MSSDLATIIANATTIMIAMTIGQRRAGELVRDGSAACFRFGAGPTFLKDWHSLSGGARVAQIWS